MISFLLSEMRALPLKMRTFRSFFYRPRRKQILQKFRTIFNEAHDVLFSRSLQVRPLMWILSANFKGKLGHSADRHEIYVSVAHR